MLPSARARVAARSALATFSALGGALKCLQLFTLPLSELGLGPGAIVGLGVAQLTAAALVVPPGRARAPAAALLLLIGLLGTAAQITGPSGGALLALMSLVVPVLAGVALLPVPPGAAPAPAPAAGSPLGTATLGALPIEQTGRPPRPERELGPRADWASALGMDEDDDAEPTPDGPTGATPAGGRPPTRPRGPW